jgi:hypothetical protein
MAAKLVAYVGASRLALRAYCRMHAYSCPTAANGDSQVAGPVSEMCNAAVNYLKYINTASHIYNRHHN